MRAPFHPPKSALSELALLTERVRAELVAEHFATAEARLLRSDEGDEQRVGTKPLHCLLDHAGRRYVLKLGDRALMAAEEAVYELRKLGDRPCVPARRLRGEIPGIGVVDGLLKPYVEFDVHDELPADTSSWTELQRSVILLEHAWEWFADNLDTNSSQYALVGPERYPVNIDWDRAFATAATAPLSRFVKYRKVLPNARTFLYADYIEGKIDLPFSLLCHEAGHIARLPLRDVRRILERYAAERFPGDVQAATALVERVLWRQRHLEREVARFVRELLRERLDVSVLPEPGWRGSVRRALTTAWDSWQLVLNAIARGPLGRVGRSVLRRLRGSMLLKQGS